MIRSLFTVFLVNIVIAITAQSELARWQSRAKQVEIIRDHYGVPHIYGKTDADAVFGLLYAQCEDCLLYTSRCV